MSALRCSYLPLYPLKVGPQLGKLRAYPLTTLGLSWLRLDSSVWLLPSLTHARTAISASAGYLSAPVIALALDQWPG
jgi:hypothetical protein